MNGKIRFAVRAYSETMLVLSEDVGATARQLERPMTQLKQAGRLRSAGQRQFTRYFPMAVRVAEPA